MFGFLLPTPIPFAPRGAPSSCLIHLFPVYAPPQSPPERTGGLGRASRDSKVLEGHEPAASEAAAVGTRAGGAELLTGWEAAGGGGEEEEKKLVVCQRCYRLRNYGSVEDTLRPGFSDSDLLTPQRFLVSFFWLPSSFRVNVFPGMFFFFLPGKVLSLFYLRVWTVGGRTANGRMCCSFFCCYLVCFGTFRGTLRLTLVFFLLLRTVQTALCRPTS